VSVVGTEDERRIASIAAYDLLKAPPRRELEALAEIAARVCDVPMATVNVITGTQQYQIATVGFDASICRREDSLCALVLHDPAPVVVPDARMDPRFSRHPYVTGELGRIRFYAAQQLATRDGVRFGTLSVFDEQPRPLLDPRQLATLATLGERIVDVFELRLRSRELALAHMEQLALQAELERSSDRLASFAGRVSHDLKTPLTTLSLSLSLIREQLAEGEPGPETIPLLDRAMNGSLRMAELIDDVLDYARLGGTLKVTEVPLGWVLDEVLGDLAGDLEGVTVEAGRLPTVLGDHAQLRAVLRNLISNAAKYRHLDRAPHVSITARHVQRAWRIEVADNGRGVPPEHRRRVFEPLARVDDAVNGSGIGLATCRRIIGAHGGSIGIVPINDVGARFYFELPD
jgi:signal transduction histidine kinase